MSHIPSFTVPRCSVEPHTSVSVSAYLGPVGRIQRSKLVCQQKNADARSKDVELACQWNCWTPEDSNPARYTNTLWWTLAEPGPEIIGQHGTSRFTPRNWQRSHDFSLMNMYEHVWTCDVLFHFKRWWKISWLAPSILVMWKKYAVNWSECLYIVTKCNYFG